MSGWACLACKVTFHVPMLIVDKHNEPIRKKK